MMKKFLRFLAGFLGCAVAQLYSDMCLAAVSLQDTIVTLQCHGTTLQSCIKDIQEKTHVRIFIPAKYANKTIWLSFDNAKLGEAFNQISSQISLTNYMLKFDDATKTIYLIEVTGENALVNDPIGVVPVADEISDQSTGAATNVDHAFGQGDADEVMPPSAPGQPGMTRAQLRAYEATLPVPSDSLDMEALPPTEAGGKGMTLRQLKANEAKAEFDQAYTAPPEVVPPSAPGGKGLTLEQLRAQEAQQGLSLPPSPLPPDIPEN